MRENGHNTVAQIFAQAAPFNWLEPYKARDKVEIVGSGFFIDDKGHMLTNYHVIAEAASVLVQIPVLGKEQLEIEIVGVCPERDIALLKLSEESVKKVIAQLGSIEYLTIGDSDLVTRNQEIYTLGYPLGQDSLKTTQGIVSGRQDIMGESFIQTTAALNPGNSGGPSLNEHGEVIGINAAIIPDAQSVGYIIPISDVKAVINDLFKVPLLRRPMLGCEMNYATPDMLRYFNNPEPGGLYIARVYPNTLFSKAGIQDGDMLYELGGNIIDIYGETNVSWSEDKVSLITVIDRFSIGQTISATIYRNGKKIETSFVFDLLELPAIRAMFPGFEKIDYEIFGGMIVMNLTLNHLTRFTELDPFLMRFRQRDNQFSSELLISYIFPNTQLHKSRTAYAGDLLDKINDQEVRTLDDFRKAISIKKDFLTIKTKSKKFTVLAVDKVLREEIMLAQEYHYPPSDLIAALLT